MNILRRPIVTEKIAKDGEKGRYGFIVEISSNKIDIKKAVQEMYGVSVESVRTMRYLGKTTQQQRKKSISTGRKSAFKKAIVTLKKGDSIDFYNNI